MTTRTLPPEEWAKLADTPTLGSVWARLRPDIDRVLVVEEGDQIVGCWACLPMWHLEGCWTGGSCSVARRLWIGVKRLLGELGVARVWTAAARDDAPVLALLRKHAEPVTGAEHFVWPLGES